MSDDAADVEISNESLAAEEGVVELNGGGGEAATETPAEGGDNDMAQVASYLKATTISPTNERMSEESLYAKAKSLVSTLSASSTLAKTTSSSRLSAVDKNLVKKESVDIIIRELECERSKATEALILKQGNLQLALLHLISPSVAATS